MGANTMKEFCEVNLLKLVRYATHLPVTFSKSSLESNTSSKATMVGTEKKKRTTNVKKASFIFPANEYNNILMVFKKYVFP